MSELYQNLSHSKWDCKYHVVFAAVSELGTGKVLKWSGKREGAVNWDIAADGGLFSGAVFSGFRDTRRTSGRGQRKDLG